ncbi:hypothetical protein GCM10028800_03450 [Nesterenkonia populi]
MGRSKVTLDLALAHLTPLGILLPPSVLESTWFSTLAGFVAINTVMYVALAVTKVLPKLYVSDWRRGRQRRSETRSIYPDRTAPRHAQSTHGNPEVRIDSD